MRRLLCGVLVAAASMVFAPSAMAGFGLQRFSEAATNQSGSLDVQAGSHPYALTTTFSLTKFEVGGEGLIPQGNPKDVRLELPPGFVGDPNATPKCAYSEFATGGVCPNDTVVGVAITWFSTSSEISYVDDPVYNLEPSPGVAAEFAFKGAEIEPVFLDASVRTGSDYGITENVRNITQTVSVYASKVTIWGVPAEASHNRLRGTCLSPVYEVGEKGLGAGEDEQEGPAESYREWEEKYGNPDPTRPAECPVNVPERPLLTNPTSCATSRTATFSVDSWQEPRNEHSLSAAMPDLSGCEKLDFSPTIGVTPDGTAGSTPTGLNVEVHVPQESTSNPVGLGEADVKDTTVTLPAGVQLSPSAADGLQACSNAQIGFTGFKELNPLSEPGVKTPQFTPWLPGSIAAVEAGETEPLRPGVNFCPNASKIANVKIKAPLLEGELEGSVYLAAPQNFAGLPENPFSSLIALYLVAEEPVTGVLVKLAGKVSPNPETGQLTTTFENTPEVPFSDLKLEFYGTDRAPLTTPGLCGTYTTESSFVPWSGTPAVSPPASFRITSGPQLQTATGAQTMPCPNPPGDQSMSTLPFAPSLASGTTNINAGSFSELTTTLGREDGNQQIQSVTLHYPAGLSGLLSGVKLCGEQQADEGTCGPESQIGESIVSVGLGNDPFTVVGGKVYITGPYEGAPFGLSIVNPAKAGPFDLQEGRPVVVRAKIEVNPITAALTVTTNTSGPYAIPHIIEGIPLQIKHVNVLINRADFTFNPTNCNPTQVTGTINSDEGASSPVAIPFQVTNCASLKFAPKFAVSTSGKTSKAEGASLTATVTEPSDPAGQANIAAVKVDLPRALPSRLKTLQKACTNAQFELNPANCPSASFIGHAVVHTPLLPVPLEGPAIFVSHGGEAFPSLTMVLQGDNVTIDLVGATYISPAGITSTTFKTVPDQPFNTFELTLPEGPYSALAAHGNLCALTTTVTVKKKETIKVNGRKKTVTRKVKEIKPESLVMPTAFVAQNGAEIHENTAISVTGCKKAAVKKATKKKKKGKKKAKKKAKK